MNIISKVGFGTGVLKIEGTRVLRNKSFVLPPSGNSTLVPMFRSPIESSLTFEWFLEHVVCKEKPWLCEQIEVDASSSRQEETIVKVLNDKMKM